MGAAVEAQCDASATWLGSAAGAHPDVWQRPSNLSGWTIGDLTRHLVNSVSVVTAHPDPTGSPGKRASAMAPPGTAPAEKAELTAVDFVRGPDGLPDRSEANRFGPAAEQGGGAEQGGAAERSAFGYGSGAEQGGDAVARLPAELIAAGRAAGAVAREHPEAVITSRHGAIRLGDFLATRCVEVVVHTRDLARSLEPVVGTGQYPPFDDDATRAAVTLLLDALAAAAPGAAVEVRVPPFAATQCLTGPRHTRGTPSNTVETDPGTWLDLASGRSTWNTALTEHRVVVSGVRADLSQHLPVMAPCGSEIQ